MSLSASEAKNRRSVSVLLVVLAVIAVAIAANWLGGRQRTAAVNVEFTLITGQASVTRADAGSESLTEAGRTVVLQSSDVVETSSDSAALLSLGDGARLDLGENTSLGILEAGRAGVVQQFILSASVDRGRVVARLEPSPLRGGSLRLETRVVTVETKQAVLECQIIDKQQVTVFVHEGSATVSMGDQVVDLETGQGVRAALGQPLIAVQLVGGAPIPLVALTPVGEHSQPPSVLSEGPTPTTDSLFPAITTPTRPGDDRQVYTVQEGDTLYSIARRFGVSWRTVWEANKDVLSSPELIKAGQKLCIP